MKFKLGDKVIVIRGSSLPIRGTITKKLNIDYSDDDSYYRIKYEIPIVIFGGVSQVSQGIISSSVYHESCIQLDIAEYRNEKIKKIL